MQTVGDRIRLLRIDKNMTQKELAKELGIGYSTVQGYEQGLNKLSQRGLRLLSTYFDVSEDYILGRTSERNPVVEGDQPVEIAGETSETATGISPAEALDIVDKLERLIKIYKDGDITADEYRRIKKRIIE